MQIINGFRCLLILSVLGVQVISCTAGDKTPISPEQRLQDLGMDEERFSSLAACDQIKIYAEIGLNYLDMGHFVAVVPSWMDEVIDQIPPETAAQCIAEEGTRQLDLLAHEPDARHEISLTIHALIYKAYNLHLFDYSAIQKLLHQVTCENDVEDSYTLVLIYYTNQTGAVLDYKNGRDAEQEMIAELCKTAR